jgi:uncharacterized membrane protein
MENAMQAASARPLHPLHAILLGFPIALFAGALASDVAFLRTAQMQWSNFSGWLIAGGCFFGGLVIAWALIAYVLGGRSKRGGTALAYLVVLAIMWVAGLVNAFQHSRDGWSSVGTTGLVLSIVAASMALVAGWIGYSGRHGRRNVGSLEVGR